MHTREFEVECEVSPNTVIEALRKLPTGKAPGPDGIPNGALKEVCPEIAEELATAISNCLKEGTFPRSMKESTTVVVRKERKKDYSLPQSYRPVALENTIAKVIEKIVADRMSEASEENKLLPWTQMGARKNRSTLSALELLTSCVQTAWKARPGCVVSMLSLDISGAYDHVSHKRLLWVLENKGFPKWILQFIQNFLSERRTKISFVGYKSPWIYTDAGIP